MTARFTTREFDRALLRKGFVAGKGAKHKRLTLMDGQVQTHIHTVVSRSNYVISSSLGSRIASQLRMPNLEYLSLYVECAVSHDDYIKLLRSAGAI